uniref:NADH dehydrogenase [ubiquinone] 1 alpha subcomplex subunit 13 n=1 Tax=Aegilops tauschii subsp. strangulata TaxID=200361 RepID=A0A453IS45_AEGTS
MTESMVRNKPGMASVKDMPVLQDGPPPGGFAPVRYARRIPNKGPSAIALFLTTFGAFSWGMYQVGQGNKVRRALKEEKIAARSAILPMLQAEEDERYSIDNVCHFHLSLSSTKDMRSLIFVQICQRMEEVP